MAAAAKTSKQTLSEWMTIHGRVAMRFKLGRPRTSDVVCPEKTLESGKDKKDSVRILLDKTAPDPAFRKTLETEAQELSAIGNSYMIRHTEIGKTPLSSPKEVEYFFHRMFSL